MIWIAFLICFIPLIAHLANDAHGDRKKGNDIIVVVLLAIIIAVVNFFMTHTPFIKSLALCFGIHFALFDYFVVYLLRKNGVISPHSKILTYTGSGKIDTVVARINPFVRLAIRVIVLGAVIAYFVA